MSYDLARPDGPKTGRLARYTAAGDAAAPSSERVLLGTRVGDGCGRLLVGEDCLPSEYIGHTIADVEVAPDGSLFVSAGDAATSGTASEASLRAQDLNSAAGKVLRVDRATGAGLASNPFWMGDARVVRSKVWASGLRNPFRFDFRPGTSVPTTGFDYTPPAGTTSVTVAIRRAAPSGGATVSPVLLYDGCGAWPTFVGGGPGAFR